MYYVYMLRCTDNTIYTGITTDLQRRFKEHKSKDKRCAKYTLHHDVICIESAWKCSNRSLASRLEYGIKMLDKTNKEKLIQSKVGLEDLLPNIDSKEYIRFDLT